MLFLFGLTKKRIVDAPEAVPLSDSELVREAQANPAHFTALYERYLTQIYSYCYVRLGSHEAAEDATSEIFLKAFAALPRYRDQMFAAWLFRIAHNVVINVQRQSHPNASLEIDSLPDPAPGLEQTLIEATQRQSFRAALAQLPDEQRTVLELDCANLSGPQIAAAMGKSMTAVRMLRHRAILRLKQLIATEEVSL